MKRNERHAARPRRARRPRGWRPRGTLVSVALGGLIAALLLAAVRTEIQRLRYERAEILRETDALGDELDAVVVQMRTLRHPMRLSRLARERGFARPRTVIQLRNELRVAARDPRP
ncbi:MAG: hypothetical protein JSU66_04795 [Deltaproteobacteria bacterium]|nr:MAG: hypothetical protein JSU66_04795 [Deltaproteobacteria bacterium]